MTVETTLPARTAYDDWLDRRWRLTGAVLGLLAVVTASLMVTLGLRPATYGDLLADVASGKVAEVRVIGPDAPSEGDTVELRWSSLGGVLDQYVVVQVAGSSGYDISGERLFATQVDPRDILRGISPSVQLTEASSVDDPPVTFMGWGVPGQVALLGVATWLGVLLLVVGGPEPWRATRWAWGWAWLLSGPLGSVAYLLLGGPTGFLRPRDGHRRLTGGWAFLLVGVLFAGWRETSGG